MKECKGVRGLLALRSDDWNAKERACVEAHLATCTGCTALARTYAAQDLLIRRAPRVGLTSSQRDQLLSRVQRERRRNEMRTRLAAILGTAAAIAALAAFAFGLNGLFRHSGPPVPSAPTGPHAVNADEALWVTIDAAWDKDLAHQTTAILQRQPWWDGEIILFTYEDNLPDSAGGGHQQVLSWVLVEPDPLEPGWTVVASGNKDVIHWPVEQAMPTPADVGVYSFFLSQRQDNLGRAMSVIYGLWVDDLDVPDTVQLTLGGQGFDAPLENESFLYVTEGHIAGQRPQIRWTCDSPGGTPCGISLRTDEPLPGLEPLVFGGEIRSDELMLDSLTGKRIPFTIGRDSTDPFAPARLYLPANVYFNQRWRVVAPPSAEWNVSVHLLNAAGELVLQSDVAVDWPAQPCPDDEYNPEECTITTKHEWQFPADFPAGLYTITVGLYDPQTGVRAPVTSPPGATSPVALGQVQVISDEPSTENTQVTLGVFSGRPNPSWTLTPAQDAELRQRLDALTLTDQLFPFDEMKPGYYGFALLLPASEEMPSRTVSVFKGIVRVERTGGQVTQLADDDRALERWLLITAAGYVEPDVIEAVRQELEPISVLPPVLGKLAYVQGGDIWVKDLPDGEPQRLTGDGSNGEPRWSPSGNWLAFRKGDDVWIIHADGTNARRVPAAPIWDCTWSPVADRLAYISGQTSLRVIEPDVLADTGPEGEGQVILQAAINEQPLTTIQYPVWSPDERQLAYVLHFRRPDALPDVSIGIADLESGPRELYAPPSPSQDDLVLAGWTPDGQSVLFWPDPSFSASALADGQPLLRLPLGGGKPVQVADSMLLHTDFRSSSPTGQHIALTVGAGRETWTNKRIVLIYLETGGWKYLTDEAVSAFSPTFSPDGSQIAYVAAPDVGHVWGGNEAKAGAAQRRIWVMNVDGSDQHPLTDDPAYRDERPLWSRDGTYVLFARMDNQDRASLWIIPAGGGEPQQIVDGLMMDELTGWFGNYGHIEWDVFFDWWRGAGPV